MDHPSISWRRHVLAVIAIGLMVAGVAFGVFSETQRGAFAEGVFIKTGTTLLVCWLAYPQLQKLNWWVVLPSMATIGLAVFRPQLIFPVARLLVVLAPVLFFVWLLRKPGR